MTILSECRMPNCHNEFEFGNNGIPLISGQVCDDCNDLVVFARLGMMNKNV